MAEELADGEFWLPSEFLDDDVFPEEQEEEEQKKKNEDGGECFSTEFPYSCGSKPSSPVASVAEKENSYEEEQRQRLANLSIQMGGTSLYSSAFATCNLKASLAGSPQSTLCVMRSLSMSSRGSSDGPSQVSSPPSPLEPQSNDAWGLLHAAAGQVVKMKLQEEKGERGSFPAHGLLGPPKEATTAIASSGYYSNPAITQHQLQVTRFQQLKQQQLLKQKQQQCSAGWGRQSKGRGVYGFGQERVTSRQWPPPQQQTHMGSGMTAVFLDGAKRESGGTGVFLPRRTGSGPSEMRRKPACSTVLLPARVVQALNLNLDEIGARHIYPGGFILDYDTIRARSSAMLLQKQRQQSVSAQKHVGLNNVESRLPPDWTY